MGVFSSKQNTQNAIDAENNYYAQAAGYMDPYTEHAGEDFGNARNLVYQGGQQRMAGSRYGQMPNNYIMSPEELLQQGESSFKMNPAEQEKMKYSVSLANNTMNENGMYGSEDNAFVDAGIFNTLSSSDMSHYLKTLDESAKQELGLSNRYAKNTNELISLFQDILGTEYKGSEEMGRNAMRAGDMESRAYDRGGRNSPGNSLLQAAGTGFGIYQGNRMMHDREQEMHDREGAGYGAFY